MSSEYRQGERGVGGRETAHRPVRMYQWPGRRWRCPRRPPRRVRRNLTPTRRNPGAFPTNTNLSIVPIGFVWRRNLGRGVSAWRVKIHDDRRGRWRTRRLASCNRVLQFTLHHDRVVGLGSHWRPRHDGRRPELEPRGIGSLARVAWIPARYGRTPGHRDR